MAVLCAMPSTTVANQSVDSALQMFAWEKRQILLFAPGEKSDNFQEFIEASIAASEEIDDRRLQIWQLIPDQPVKLDMIDQDDLSAKDFYAQYGVAEGEFRVILIGYDQGEKLRQDNVDLEYIFAEIDQMPMRIEEMQAAEMRLKKESK